MRIRSLETVLALWVSAVVAGVLLANAGVLVLTARSRQRERLEENARLFAGLATEPLCRAFDTFEASGFFRFRQIADDLLRQAPDVEAFEIVDVSGRVLFQSQQLELGPAGRGFDSLSPERLDAVRELQPREFRGQHGGAEVLEIVMPHVEDFGRHRLSVVYRISYARLGGELQRHALLAVALCLASIALAGAIGFGLARRVTRPLAELMAGVAAIARGQFDRRLALHSGDELQLVAEAFNEMAERLSQTVAELQRSLARWRSLVEGAPVVVLTTSPDGEVDFTNVHSEQAGRSLGRRLDDAAGAGFPAMAMAVLEQVRETGHPGSFEAEAPALAGTGRVWYSVHVGAVREGNAVAGLTLVGVDVTEARAARQERERLIAELEKRNAELERFAYTVSHDLRSPLVTVKGFLGAVESAAYKGQTERVREDVARIRAAADRMDQLLRDLLELSRVGRVTNEPELVPFRALVEEARAQVAGRLAERGVRVEVAEALPSVRCDRQRMVEVVQNLLDNAAKFMGSEPHPLIQIGVREASEPPVFYVRDNGIGIPQRHHERVFGLFDRLDPAVPGTGVGLALVRRIVEVHGGRVWIESEGEGTGTTFCFTLGVNG